MNIKLTQLSPEKRKFVLYLKFLNFNKPSPSEIQKQIGISRTTYYRWLHDRELLKIAEEVHSVEIKKHLPEILKTLLDKALQGDVSAIKLILKRIDKINKEVNKTLTPDEIIILIRKLKKEKNEKISKK